MEQVQLSQRLSIILMIVLCLSLPAAAGTAAEVAGKSTPVSESATAAPNIDRTASAQAGTAPASPQPLSAEELKELSGRAEEPGPEVVGGALSNLHLTYIVIALAAAVIVLIAK